ncbi:hypothetical protein F443_05180 [Phytophthora nicotianae P1569]|uniref:Uncharacterized protein n=1 Tax=Phytophthora nicotianae P1569 TaxID=1317065 RepID=V9FIZ5_PHYNI|nr:hypothetical protein F443_05180 [Phytophthora nicotianae P1569]
MKDRQDSSKKSSRTSNQRPGDAVSWRQRHPCRRQQKVIMLRPYSRRDDPGDEGAKLDRRRKGDDGDNERLRSNVGRRSR